MWCEDCGKDIIDKTRHFRSEIHTLKNQNRQQNNLGQDTQSGMRSTSGVKTIVNEKHT